MGKGERYTVRKEKKRGLTKISEKKKNKIRKRERERERKRREKDRERERGRKIDAKREIKTDRQACKVKKYMRTIILIAFSATPAHASCTQWFNTALSFTDRDFAMYKSMVIMPPWQAFLRSFSLQTLSLILTTAER